MKTAPALILALCLLTSSVVGWEDDVSAFMRRRLGAGAGILMDIREGRVLAAAGGEILLGRELPAGSLMKLFTLTALLAGGAADDEVFFCGPSSPDVPSTSACWYRPGHGNMTLRAALAHSCNAYFRQWLIGKDLGGAKDLLRELQILRTELPEDKTELMRALLGFTPAILVRPADLACAMGALFNGGTLFRIRKAESGERCSPVGAVNVPPEVVEVLKAGMRECALHGTGKAVQEAMGMDPILVKTGTSAHWMSSGADPLCTDGWCLVLFPADAPVVLLLVFQPDTSGAEGAAGAAGDIMKEYLRELEQ